MTLCDNTLMVLKNFAGINNSILVKKGTQLRTISVAKNILAEAEIAPEEFPRDFAIYDLNQFLNGLGLHQDPDLDYEVDLSTIDDQYAHHFAPIEKEMAHYFKYHEKEILKDIEEYVSGTYKGHYTGNSHEYRNVQTLDLMAARSVASGFCQANILKYGCRYGSKDGKNKKDLMKVIHYAMLLLHFDDHYGKPSMPSGNFEQMP